MDKNSNKIPGLAVKFAYSEVLKKVGREPKIYDEDSRNRQWLMHKGMEFIKKGKSLDETVRLLMEDKNLMKKFEYWEKNGLDVRTCIKNLLTTHLKKIEAKER